MRYFGAFRPYPHGRQDEQILAKIGITGIEAYTTGSTLAYGGPVTVLFSDENIIRYVLPVLCMTLCCLVMGEILIQTWSLRRNELFTVVRQVAQS